MKNEKENRNNVALDAMCRLCLTPSDDNNSVEIFHTNELSLTLRIMACAGLEVTQNDLLPKRICLQCRLKLEESFLFRNKCKNTDSRLRRHLRLINAGKESDVFDESDDEFESENAESIQAINDIEAKIKMKKQNTQTESMPSNENNEQQLKLNTDTKLDSTDPLSLKQNNRNVNANHNTYSKMRTRSSNQQKNVTPNKSNNSNRTIEVLLDDDLEYDNGLEYVICDPFESNTITEPFTSTNSNDDLNMIINEDNTFEADTFQTQNIIKQDDETSDNSIGVKSADEENSEEYSYDAFLLESILPTIKQSIAANVGTVLDDKAQYKIVRTSGDEIKVQCITSDGKEFEIEMVQQPNAVERDEFGDLKIFACSICGKTFSRRGKLINHERDHTAKSNGQDCPYCEKRFPSNSTLTRHIRVHTGEKPFKCNVCNRAFIQKEILKRHSLTHSGERPFKCAQCPKSFILKEALRQHINRNHTDNPTPEMHQCQFCPKTFYHSSGLSRHLLIHAGRTFPCEYCHKKFNDKSALKRHTASIHKAAVKMEKNKF